MSRIFQRLRCLLLTGLVAGVGGTAVAAGDVPLKSGRLVDIHRRDALAQIHAMPGVVLVDCFADW